MNPASNQLENALPVNDWQFWVVTLITLAAVGFIAWRLVGGRLRKRRSRPTKTRATLTIEGAPVAGNHIHKSDSNSCGCQ